ncbi:uncharacterized protein [Palaemon carinicauda]|uniref:uncharacterized protein n=1 Tax=Palaemon carinicauda TaxID=392227 RepID=UPI0035B6A22D
MHIDCPYFTGRTEVALLDRELPCEKADILLGNDLAEGTVLPNLIISQPGCVIENEQNQQEVLPCQATTRSAATKAAIGVPTDDDTSNSLPDLVGLHHDEFVNLQRSDDSLKGCFNKVENPSDKSHKLPLFYLENNILMRHYRSPTLTEKDSWRDCHQLVVPGSLRSSIMKLAHSAESHLGITKTYRRLLEDFYWPRMKMDVKSFVERCHVCQATGRPNEKIPPAPLVPIVVPSTPFDKIIIDCVGPLPKTSRRNEYILSVLCPTTRFPLAFPPKNISARNIIQQLIKVFTLFGFPRELQCDRGTNFTSTLFQSALHQFNIFNVLSSAYHPQSNGALERFHQTLKNLLRRYGMETEKEWDEDIDLLLYILRSVPNESTGVSPFEMMFGRRPRSNLSMIKEQILKGSRKENQVDASNIGFGGVLLQEIASDGAVSLPLLERLLPIAYHSGFFKGSKLRWATVEKELFSIINTVLHFRPYLEGLDNVVVYSDHMPLSFLHRAKFTNQKLLRWSYILSSFNIEVRKISGSRNTIADALSRQPRLQRS